MKVKIIGALLMVMAIAGTAAAYQPCGDAPRHEGRRHGGRELSQEERVQFDALKKLQGEIRAELSKDKPDKAKARKLFEKELDLRESFMAERFNDCLANHDKDSRCRWRDEGGRGRGDSDGAWRELRQEMSKDYPNKAKALELYKEASKTRREQAKARFVRPSRTRRGLCRMENAGADGRRDVTISAAHTGIAPTAAGRELARSIIA